MDRFDRHPRHGWPEKTITFPGRFFYFSRRHCLEIESLATPAAWRGFSQPYPPKERKPVRGAKEWRTGVKDAPRVGR
ncbi:hypothetical protein [Bifidobacterium adolescentis]|uniref:hypothetical protein n=1 Tax=Bifidobacterium adolescentis TaxID=1680 RepID=UPI0018974802|nr:hypothetical protein [Bifidobacterium adolescentis]MDB1433954.1 hypothetical protein [Bifidobacterium adolescentis]MDB1545601.1 hypothetical protein [Bifidobacterium adolescentis]